jgi:hypothetical protein
LSLNRQQLMLIVLLLVAAVAAFIQFRPANRLAASGAADDRGGAENMKDLPPAVKSFEDADRPGLDISGGRSLFDYGRPKIIAQPAPSLPPPPPRPPRPPPVLLPPGPQAADGTAADGGSGGPGTVPAAEPPRPLPTPPPVNFVFVGYLGRPGSLIGVFRLQTPEGDETVLAREGETLAEEFKVHRISYEEVEIGYTQERFKDQTKILPMGGRS